MLQLTQKAVNEINKVIENNKLHGTYVRAFVAGSGCSGIKYGLKFENDYDEQQDKLIEQNNIKLLIDLEEESLFNFVSIDFHEDDNKRGFIFNNPLNVSKSCGGGTCGSGQCSV